MQNRRIRQRSPRKPLWQKAIISLFALIVLVGGAGAAYVINLGGVTKIIEQRITVLSGAEKVSVGGASLRFQSSLIPIFFRVSDVGMSLADTDLIIPQADIMFGLNSLISGGPTEIAINGLELDIGRSEDGWSASPLAVFLFDVMQNASSSKDTSASNDANALKSGNAGAMTGAQSMMQVGLERLTVRANRLSLVHQNANIAPLVFKDAAISLTVDPETGIGGYVTANRILTEVGMPVDHVAGNIKIDFVGWPVGEEFLVDMTVNNVATSGLATYFDELPMQVDGMGIVTGAASVALNNAEIARMDVAIKTADGMITMPGSADEAGFESAMLDASYRRDADLLSVATAQLKLADGREFAFSGDVVNVHTPRPSLVGALGINRMPLTTLKREWPITAAPEAKAALFDHFSGGALENILLDFVGGYDVATGQLSVSKMDVEAAYNGVRMDIATGQYRRIVGTVDGAINLKIGAGGQVQNMSFGMQLGSGSLLVEGYESNIGLDSVVIKAAMKNSVFSLSQFDVALADGASLKIGGNVMLAPDWSPQGLSMSMATKRMRLDIFHALWPDWAKKPVRNWVKSSIPEGLIQDAALGFDVVYIKDVPRLQNLTGALTLANGKLVLSKKMPPMENVYGKLNIEGDAATIILNQANIKDLALQYGRVTMSPLFAESQPKAEMRLTMKGGLSTAVEVGRGFGVGKVGVFDLETMQPEGEIEITLNANFPLGSVIPQEKVDITAAATISNGSFLNLPYDMVVENGELVANVAKDLVEITGTADVSGVPSDFSFRSDAINDNVSFIGKMVPSTVMASSLAQLTSFEIGGRVGGSVTMSTDMSFETVKIQLNADMRGASVNVPILSWAKLPAENGHARMTFVLRDGRIDTLQDVDIALGSLSVIGQVLLGQGGSIQGVFLERAKWPGNDLREVMIENSDDGMKIGAQARLVDLSPLRRNSGVGAERNISFDIIAEQFVIGDGITLSGHLTGNKRRAGGGDALFNGDLMFQGRTRIAESEIKLRFGRSVERLTGTGLVGGAEAEINFVSSENTRPKLIMKSENAGRMLNGLNVTDAIRSGSIVLTNEFVKGNFAEFDTDIKMRNFNVVEAPRAVRAFSVLGPVGLLQLVKGDGTPFEWGEARFEKRGSNVNITKMRGGGSAVALSLVGRYDTVSRDVDVSGNLVPASLVNQVIGAVPLLGNLLTGVDKGGLFVTQFSMTGSIDDPKTTANAASLIPGVLRDVVSPDWLAREGARILGTDSSSDTEAESQPQPQTKPQTETVN
ncbi:DUF3971 domain-containing protein [Alphaproteobacteria bacterium]|nr:DUF3971 domain-containing protein [Alphaproteobacteria bacterium]